MAFDLIAANKIREAIQQGAFDNLPNAGKPLDLDGYFAMPEHLRAAYALLKSANCVPAEVELLNQVAALERQLAAATDEQAPAIRRQLIDRQTHLAVVLERARRQK